MSKTFTTEAGTQLPLISLKGKDYLQVAHRVQWFNEKENHFSINTQFLVMDDTQTVCRAEVTVFDEKGRKRTTTATKRETKADFSDHSEKAETSAIGRALALLGYGTQFAVADFEEGARLADSPMPTKVVASYIGPPSVNAALTTSSAPTEPAAGITKTSGFKRITKPTNSVAPQTSGEIDI